MVKVIQENPPKLIICNFCKAILEYTSDDIKYDYEEKNDRDYKYLFIECPICREKERIS